MSKAGGDRTRSLTRREALKGATVAPAGALVPKVRPMRHDGPEGDLACLRGLMATFTAAQEKAWHMREGLEQALFATRGSSEGLASPLKSSEPAHGMPEIDEGADEALEPYERARIDAREAIIEAPARTLVAVAAKLRWVAQEYTTWLEEDEDLEDEVEARAGRRVLADLEALAGL